MNKFRISNFILKSLSFKFLNGFYGNLLSFSHSGMNFGNATLDMKNSGEIRFLKSILNKNDLPKVIIDVGANKGDYSKICLNESKNNLKLILFEPIKETFHILKERFKDENSIIFYNVALGDFNGTSEIYFNKNQFATPSLLINNFETEHLLSEQIEVKILQNLLKDLQIEEVFLLKIDVEGYEMNVLKGALEFIKNKKIKNIQFEFGKSNMNNKNYFKDFYNLLSENYDLFIISKWGLIPIEKYHEKYEIFTTATNFVAKIKI